MNEKILLREVLQRLKRKMNIAILQHLAIISYQYCSLKNNCKLDELFQKWDFFSYLISYVL